MLSIRTIEEQRNLIKLARKDILAMLVYEIILDEAENCNSIGIAENDIVYLLKNKDNIRASRFAVRKSLLYLNKVGIIKAMHCGKRFVFVLRKEDEGSKKDFKITLRGVDLGLN